MKARASTRNEAALRRAVIEACRSMNALGINQGTSGNLSVRLDDKHILITPSGLPYERMRPADLPVMDMAARWSGRLRPSSEWRFHRDILRARPDVAVVLHTHSRNATALACLGEDLPPFHYMIAAAGTDCIRCAPYATFGSQALSDHALAALGDARACLLANHGLIVVERSIDKALALAVEVETLAGMYLAARAVGKPRLLSRSEMVRVLELFRTYGTPEFPDDGLVAAGRRAVKRRRGR